MLQEPLWTKAEGHQRHLIATVARDQNDPVTCRWFLSHAEGHPHTGGSFNEAQYRYAIQLEAQEPNNVSACFRLPAWAS